MTFKVTLDFHDNAIQNHPEFELYSDLASYLETVPSMIGFQLNGIVDIRIINNEVDRDCDVVRSCRRRNGHKGAHNPLRDSKGTAPSIFSLDLTKN